VRLRQSVKGLLISGISCLLASLAACGSPPSESPGLRAINQLQQQLQNPAAVAQFNGEDATAGATDPVIAWVGGPRRMVTVESASLIALPGFRLPDLIDVGAVPGCLGQANISANADPQNNVSVTVNGHDVVLIPIQGYRLRTGNARCVPTLVYEVQDGQPGEYAVAGLKLDVISGGRTDSVTADDGDFIWYFSGSSAPTKSQYNARYNAAAAAQSAYWQAHS
jgi:hypothetical protein